MSDVQTTIDAFFAAWGEHDADAMAAHYLEDATTVIPGSYQESSAALRDYFAERFAGPLKGTRTECETLNVRYLDDDNAIVVSRVGMLFPGETEVPKDREQIGTWTMRRQGDAWKVAAYSNASAVR
ncbi:MAG: SgcJ/EcaC family oxidoreductase [Nonomuraea sp.]|nr:SgcJ/EcaC family oxidoreductase [Nonomuraea sp.]